MGGWKIYAYDEWMQTGAECCREGRERCEKLEVKNGVTRCRAFRSFIFLYRGADPVRLPDCRAVGERLMGL